MDQAEVTQTKYIIISMECKSKLKQEKNEICIKCDIQKPRIDSQCNWRTYTTWTAKDVKKSLRHSRWLKKDEDKGIKKHKITTEKCSWERNDWQD